MLKDTSNQKTVYVVIGMARSGTSVITRSLKALGINLGEKLYPANNRNPKGFWEDVDVAYKINRSLLYVLDYPWVYIDVQQRLLSDPHLFVDFKAYAANLIKDRLSTCENWAFKDPRTATLLPFWQSVFTSLDVNDRYIIALRNPLASAHSNQKLTKKDLEGGLLAWLMHLMAAVDCTHGKQRIVVAYEEMMRDPRTQLNRIKGALSISDTLDPSEIDSYVNEFLDKKLHHYTFNNEELNVHPSLAVVRLCLELYKLLLRLATDEISFESLEFESEWHKIKEEFIRMNPMYHYVFTLLRQNKKLERELRTIRKSMPWKILSPLRLIDDILRSRRKKIRERSKLVKVYG